MAVIRIRRLAALDLAFLGPTIILTEFALGVIGPIALGVMTLHTAQSLQMDIFGWYLVALGLNYVPLLLYAVNIVRRGTAQAEVADEAGDRTRVFRRYRRQSLLLLLPLVVPIIAAVQERRRSRDALRNRAKTSQLTDSHPLQPSWHRPADE